MAKGPEARFRDSVERKIKDKTVYIEGMANPYRGGTPDRYYEGPQGVLWVEYKIHPNTTSPLQEDWLKRAHGNNVNVAIITGYDKSTKILNLKGMGTIIRVPNYYRELATHILYTPEEIAQWIEEQVNGHKNSGRNSRKTD